MKHHAIRLPRIYQISSRLYEEVKEGASLKELLYTANHQNKQGIHALVLKTLQNDAKLDYILQKSEFLEKASGIQERVARVLITELLWGKQTLSSDCRPIQAVLAYQDSFRAHCSAAIEQNIPERITNIKVLRPRFVRVNSLKLQMNDAVEAFCAEGWTLKTCKTEDYDKFLKRVKKMTEKEFMIDMHIKDMLIFPPKTTFQAHAAYLSGEILLQDKASCLPVELLDPKPGSVVLDMCAAPGMKTTYIAAKLNNQGKVFAVEKALKRYETLCSMVESAGATCVETMLKDVLTLDGEMLPDVEYILVDPSCTGSGMIDRIEQRNCGQMAIKERLRKLAGFQILALKHAMRSFPNVKRIVYSTCSILAEENELVVQDVIRNNPHFKLVPADTLITSWKNFGDEKYDVGPFCIYARTKHDFTNGFFVAVFERLEEGEINQFYNKEDRNIKRKMSDECNLDDVNENVEVSEETEQKKKKKKKKKEKEKCEDQQED